MGGFRERKLWSQIARMTTTVQRDTPRVIELKATIVVNSGIAQAYL